MSGARRDESNESNVFDLGQWRAARTADDLPANGAEYRDALANLLAALEQQPATTQIEHARVESGKAAIRMAMRLAESIR